MKNTKKVNRSTRMWFYINDQEFSILKKICEKMGTSRSELIRNRVLHPGMIHIDHSKLLIVFNHIGLEMGKLNKSIDAEMNKNGEIGKEKFYELFASYQMIQLQLEVQIRKMLIRIVRKG